MKHMRDLDKENTKLQHSNEKLMNQINELKEQLKTKEVIWKPVVTRFRLRFRN